MEAQRADLAAFVDHASRLDDAAVIRLRARSSGLLTAWMATGFDVLASRVVVGKVRPDDMTVAADGLARGLAGMDDTGYVDPAQLEYWLARIRESADFHVPYISSNRSACPSISLSAEYPLM